MLILLGTSKKCMRPPGEGRRPSQRRTAEAKTDGAAKAAAGAPVPEAAPRDDKPAVKRVRKVATKSGDGKADDKADGKADDKKED
jgi:hypothetical protein